MINLILKSLKQNCSLGKNQIMEEVAKDGILCNDAFMERMLEILEQDRKIVKLKNGQYMILEPHRRLN